MKSTSQPRPSKNQNISLFRTGLMKNVRFGASVRARGPCIALRYCISKPSLRPSGRSMGGLKRFMWLREVKLLIFFNENSPRCGFPHSYGCCFLFFSNIHYCSCFCLAPTVRRWNCVAFLSYVKSSYSTQTQSAVIDRDGQI